MSLAAPGSSARAADSAGRLRQLIDAHLAFVWRTLRRAGVSEADADDAAQRVFLTVSRRLGEIREGAERAFIYAVARGEAGHARRSYRRRREVAVEQADERSTGRPRPDDVVGRKQVLRYAGEVLDGMDETLRSVFLLYEVEEMSCSQIAEVLAIPVGTVKSRLQRAREEFRAAIGELRLARSQP